MFSKLLPCSADLVITPHAFNWLAQVSFFEWVQNQQNLRWQEDEILMRLDRQMTDAYQVTLRYSL